MRTNSALLPTLLILHAASRHVTMSAVLPLCRRQPVQYFEFRNVRVRVGPLSS